MHSELFNFFFNLSNSGFWSEFALFLSFQGSYIIIVFLFVGSIFLAKKKFLTSSTFFISIFFAWFCSQTLKFIIHMDRPFLVLDIIPLHYASGYSFPSIHSAIFASIATSMFFINKKLGIFLGFLALAIGLSRIVIGVHYPVDVLFGFLIGAASGFLAIRIMKPNQSEKIEVKEV